MAAPKKGFIHPAIHIPNEVMNALIKASSESKHPLDLESLYSKLSVLYMAKNGKNIRLFWQLALIAGLSHDIAIKNHDVSVRDDSGRNIAHFAALSVNHDALSAVLKEYPDLALQKDNEGCSSLHYAAWSGNPKALSAVLKEHSDLDNFGIAHYAAWSGNPDALSAVLKVYPDLALKKDNRDRSIAHFAALSGNPDALSAVLKEYPGLALQKDNEGRSIAHYAAWSGNPDALSAVLKEHSDLDNFGIAHYAALSGNPDALSAVLKEYPDLALQKNNNGRSIAHFAALSGNPDALSAVLETYPDLARQKDNEGGGVAHCAAWSGNPDALSAVLKAYPDLARQKDNNDLTIAHVAAWSGNPDALTAVLETYPDLARQKDNNDESIVHYAVRSGNPVLLNAALSHLKLTTLNLEILPGKFESLSLKVLREALEANTTLTEVIGLKITSEIEALLTLNKLNKNLPFIKPDELRPDKITPQCFLERVFNYQPKGFFSKGLSVEEKKMLNEVLLDLDGQKSWIACVQFMNQHVQPKNSSSLMRDLRTFAEACQTLKLEPVGPNAEPDLPQSYGSPFIN